MPVEASCISVCPGKTHICSCKCPARTYKYWFVCTRKIFLLAKGFETVAWHPGPDYLMAFEDTMVAGKFFWSSQKYNKFEKHMFEYSGSTITNFEYSISDRIRFHRRKEGLYLKQEPGKMKTYVQFLLLQ